MKVLSELRLVLSEFGLEWFRKYYSVYKAVVVSNEDPDFCGRLKLRIPQVTGNAVHEYWAPSKGMPSGKGTGLWLLPNKDDIVWVMFEAGDPRLPVWEYGPWTKKKVPEKAKTGDKSQSRAVVLQSTAGYRLVLNDKKDKVYIEAPTGDTQPAVLGNKLVDFMEEFFDDIGTLKWVPVQTIPNLGLVTGELSTSPLFPILKAKWQLKWKNVLSDILEIP